MPAWSLVRVLEPGDWGTEEHLLALFDRPELHAVQAVHGLTELNAAAVAAGARRTLTELSWEDRYDSPTIGRDHALATCDAFPELTTIGMLIGNARRLRAWFAEAPVVECITRLVVRVKENLDEMLELLATRGGALREIELLSLDRGALTDETGWRFRLRRETAPEPFVSLVARHRLGKSTRRWNFVGDLHRPLVAIPEDWLRVLHVDTGRKMTSAADCRTLGATVARFTRLEQVTVPWEDHRCAARARRRRVSGCRSRCVRACSIRRRSSACGGWSSTSSARPTMASRSATTRPCARSATSRSSAS